MPFPVLENIRMQSTYEMFLKKSQAATIARAIMFFRMISYKHKMTFILFAFKANTF